ncbi:MAG TPA: trehalose-6-phosphate synthase [Rubrobacteraceae bacterium]|nr:trehalose-6-phosphate synthase [Rubrobacteraceae bacterium]
MAQSGERSVIVSNRGPVTFSRAESGERDYSRGAGGLVTALNAVVHRRKDVVWIASAMSEEDAGVSKEPAPYELEDLRVTLVEHDAEAYDLMYNQIANPLLWFVQHGLYDLPYSPRLGDDTRRAWEDGYVATNRNFAEATARTVENVESPIIMLHDYQLYMVPLLLRQRLGDKADDAFISLFVHIPWPEPDYWRVLPGYIREGVLESLLEANMVAFHTRRYAQNFVDTATRVLGVEGDVEKGVVYKDGREVWVRAYPISIDPAEFEELAVSEAVLQEEKKLRELPGQLLVRVDRMDLSKNTVRGFEAYGRMLERHPEMKEQVTFLARVQPSREDVPEYAEYARIVQSTVEEINERHVVEAWTPIELAMEDNFPSSVAAYKNYDVLLVNAVRDGMNLVAKEAAVINERNGVLVLSENAGAYEELGEPALTVNPFDIDEQAEAIYEALSMSSEERRERAEALQKTVRSNTIEHWVEAQMEDIAAYRGE